jgi:uncharacterized Zn finger protein
MKTRARCPHCGKDKWKTLKKGWEWMCRYCGTIRKITLTIKETKGEK